MDKAVKIARIPTHSKEWFDYRQTGIGGSDVAAIMGLSPYKSAVQVFYDKLGVMPRMNDTIHTFWGKELEDKIAEVWQYYDGSEDYIHHKNAGNIMRKCRRINGFARRDEYPQLFYSADRLINKGQFKLLDGGPINPNEGVLEVKTAAQWALAQWEDGLPPAHVAQVVQGLLVFGVDYGEIAIFDNLRTFQVYHVSYEGAIKTFADKMLEITDQFWTDLVLPAKEIAAAEGFVDIITQDFPAGIQELEPEPDDSEAYMDFKKESYKTELAVAQGTMDIYQYAQMIKGYSAIVKSISSRIQGCKNLIIKAITDAKCQKMTFDHLQCDGGGITWKPDANKTKPTLRTNIKWKADSDIAEGFADKALKLWDVAE